jgi:hypothetical protein
MSIPPKYPSRLRDVGWLTGPQILKAVTEMIDNTGLRSEALYVSKLGYAKIIPTPEQKISRRDKSIDLR